MRGDTWILFLKGTCFVLAGATSALVAGVAQWAGSGQWPPAINWVVIVAATVGGAAAQLLAFLSQSFGDWKESRNGSFSGPGPTPDATAAPIVPPLMTPPPVPAGPPAPVPPKLP